MGRHSRAQMARATLHFSTASLSCTKVRVWCALISLNVSQSHLGLEESDFSCLDAIVTSTRVVAALWGQILNYWQHPDSQFLLALLGGRTALTSHDLFVRSCRVGRPYFLSCRHAEHPASRIWWDPTNIVASSQWGSLDAQRPWTWHDNPVLSLCSTSWDSYDPVHTCLANDVW